MTFPWFWITKENYEVPSALPVAINSGINVTRRKGSNPNVPIIIPQKNKTFTQNLT
ncbi:hypothetical protein PanWU01x14_030100, partial [Parasponia andersonii]